MPNVQSTQPTICLSMIVRNEAHVVREVLDSVAPYISTWVIVDTGSDDGTQELITSHMAELGIPGVLHERPWVNFGHNRTEAVALAQGYADYIWVNDADDVLSGTPAFSHLTDEIYRMRHGRRGGHIYWYPVLFRDGLQIRYEGVTHEYVDAPSSWVTGNLGGDHLIEDRHTSFRNISGEKFTQDRDLLLNEVERNPENVRATFYLARSYFDLGDYDNARKWFARRVELGGWVEEIYYSMLQIAQAMARSDMPWPDVQDAYLRAWAFRPNRGEALVEIARKYRLEEQYRLGHLFAECAAQIPLPEDDILFVDASLHLWRARDEQAICASQLGDHSEAMTLCRELIAVPDVPDEQRQRIAKNRDFSVPALLETASAYSGERVRQLATRAGDVTVSLIAGPDRLATEQSLNSFLSCCLDLNRIRQFLVLPAGISAADRAVLAGRYPFIEFIEPAAGEGITERGRLSGQIHGRLWLHLGAGWRFFAPERYLSRLAAVLDAEPGVMQVGINLADATDRLWKCAPEDAVRRTPDGGRYALGDAITAGPAMFDMDRLNGIDVDDPDPIARLRHQVGRGGLQTATLDEVLCIARP
ncbi:tetratricopeptide repeat-containing glycosyltransferase [[Mycobacterium] zoologicum]|uniref:tetratricopeptide repeat-containing glycosyltransferase n=1 Tax=[Mycobacterium] zoologicum TaxID=2872311 RepID=UPI002E7A0F8B|nr:glycosyltransferase [Mycolicibacter sp. MYC101]